MKKLLVKVVNILCRLTGIAVCTDNRCAAKNANEFYVGENRDLRAKNDQLQSELADVANELSHCSEDLEELTELTQRQRIPGPTFCQIL